MGGSVLWGGVQGANRVLTAVTERDKEVESVRRAANRLASPPGSRIRGFPRPNSSAPRCFKEHP